jgi:ATP-dependent Clp protease ATP-binding subunit ClpX
MTYNNNKEKFICNFCKEEVNFTKGMFVQDKYFICNICLEKFTLLNEIEEGLDEIPQEIIDMLLTESTPPKEYYSINLSEAALSNTQQLTPTIFYPTVVKKELDKFIIGQDNAKKIISTAVYNHYLRLNNTTNIDIPKNNIILIGNTGVGKTFLIECIAKLLDVPFIFEDAASLTQTGWKGNNVNTILENLIMKAEGDVRKAEKGIVYLDECDKLGRGHSSSDINGSGVQQCLLKMVEGVVTSVEINRRMVHINTKDILFIGGGAFTGLLEQINRKHGKKEGSIGFGQNAGQRIEIDKDLLHEVKSQDIIDYGFIPEFVGRFPTLAVLNDLTKEDLKRILIEPNNCLVQQYTNLFKASGIDIIFSQEIIDYIVEEAVKLNTGGRALKTVMEEVMRELMYELPSTGLNKYIITKDNYKKIDKYAS